MHITRNIYRILLVFFLLNVNKFGENIFRSFLIIRLELQIQLLSVIVENFFSNSKWFKLKMSFINFL
jgi:hypothetical protein